jgi:ectoine hydroxylase-related dioxygenase (phytanoyl-CoA dioxygenase family)
MGTAGPPPLDSGRPGWLAECLALLEERGCAVVAGVLPPGRCAAVAAALARVRAEVRAEVGAAALDAARDRGDVMIRFLEPRDPVFLGTLDLAPVRALVEAALGPDAILRFQMGNPIPADGADGAPPPQPRAWHRNFGRVPGRPGITLEVALALDDLGPDTGGPVVAPGTHRRADDPPREELESLAEPLPVPAGGMAVLAGTLWHRESPNRGGRERMSLAQQYAPPWVKPYFDYPRMLGADRMRALPERTRDLLGWRARPPATPAEFHAPEEDRTFRGSRRP